MTENAVLPPLPNGAPGTNDHKYKPGFGVVLVCPDEEAQRLAYSALLALAKCKIKVVCT